MIPYPGEDFYLSESVFKETLFPVVVKKKVYPDEKSISCIREVVTCNPPASLLVVKAQYTLTSGSSTLQDYLRTE